MKLSWKHSNWKHSDLRKNGSGAVRWEVNGDVVRCEEGEEQFVESRLQVVRAHSRTADGHRWKIDLTQITFFEGSVHAEK